MIIPTTWKDIKLQQFENAYDIETATDYDTEIDRTVDWIAALTKTDRKKIESLPLEELRSIASKLQWVKHPNFDERIPKIIFCKGKIFEVCHEVNKLNSAQYAEMNTWMKTDPMHNLDKVMATLTRERKYLFFTGEYDGETHPQRAILFRNHLSLAAIYPIALFFFRVFSRSMLNIQHSLVNQAGKKTYDLMRELQQELKNNQRIFS